MPGEPRESGALTTVSFLPAGVTPRPSEALQRYSADPAARRTEDVARAAERVLDDDVPMTTPKAFMGPYRAQAVAVPVEGFERNATARAEVRSKRAKVLRQAQSFLDDVEAVLNDAGMSMVSPSASAPVTARRSTQQRPAPDGLKASKELTKSNEFDGASSGQLLVSAFDGTAHPFAELRAYNEFVSERMQRIIDDEEEAEAAGALLSGVTSVVATPRGRQNSINSASGATLSGEPSLTSGSSASLRPRARRPASIPDAAEWTNRAPQPAPGSETDDASEANVAAVRAYNAEAREAARRLVAHKCFRGIDFAAAYLEASQ